MATKCFHCGAENATDARTCAQCGNSIVRGPAEIEHEPGEGFRRATVIEQDQPRVIPRISEEEPRLAAGKHIGNYAIEQKIASGGMSTVYLARHRDLEVLVALKALHPSLTTDRDFRQRFLREARIQSHLYHPNIAQVRDYIEHEGHYYLIMEYLEGGTLADALMKQRDGMQIDKALGFLAQALEGLGYAHDKDVVHRDIKPTNIMLDRFGHAKIMDFGIAVATGQKRLTSTGVTIGTAQYMSPEQIRRPLEVDRRTDIYSMGIVLFELLTGGVPFEAASDFEIQRAHVQDPPPPPSTRRPGLDKALDGIVLKALEKRPEDRYPDCTEFSKAIAVWKSFSSQEPSHEPPRPSPKPVEPLPQPAEPLPKPAAPLPKPSAPPGKAPQPTPKRETTTLEKWSGAALGIFGICIALFVIDILLQVLADWLDLQGLKELLRRAGVIVVIVLGASLAAGLVGLGLNAIMKRRQKVG